MILHHLSVVEFAPAAETVKIGEIRRTVGGSYCKLLIKNILCFIQETLLIKPF